MPSWPITSMALARAAAESALQAEDPSRTWELKSFKERRSPGWKIRLGDFLPPGEALAGLEAGRVGGGKIRLGDFLPPGEALTGLEAGRSVSAISCPQERRSPGWRREDPSRRFLAPRMGARRVSDLGILRRGAHRAGGGKIRLGPGNSSLLTRGAHRAGGGKIRLGDFLSPKKRRSPGWRREDPSRTWELKSFKAQVASAVDVDVAHRVVVGPRICEFRRLSSCLAAPMGATSSPGLASRWILEPASVTNAPMSFVKAHAAARRHRGLLRVHRGVAEHERPS